MDQLQPSTNADKLSDPLLAEVGKEILKERAWLECAVARRFVQYSG
jgi:hypothetical protein